MCTCTLARRCLDNRVFAASLHGVARLAVACTRAACLPERASRGRACTLLWAGSLDVHHVDVALLQTQNDERDDDERDDDERDEPDEREEVPDERVRVRFKNCETKRPRLGARTLKSLKS